MAVSGINNYQDVLYQWQAQQLKSTGKSSSNTSSAASNLFNNTSMTQQISSMVELTKYAMDAMGLTSDSRVTFSQITKYQNQLQNEFNQSVKNGFANSGIANVNALSFSLDKYGKITVIGSNSDDRQQAQAWLDSNPSFGNELRSKLDKSDHPEEISFTISSTGKINVKNDIQENIQNKLDQKSDLTSDLRNALKEIDNINLPLAFTFDEDGNLQTNNENSAQINEWLADNQDFAAAIKKEIEKSDADLSAVTLKLNSTGNLQISVNNAEINDAQAILDQAQDIGQKIHTGLNNLKIDPNINFSIQIGDDGSFNIISDHPDRDKVQRFFENNPELIKKYRQIETLASIEDARKAMQVSPSAMRKRIQIESMMSWWASSNDSTSYFGNYSNNSLSLLSGLNLTV